MKRVGAPTSASDTQRLLDRAAIHDLLARYFQGLDRADPAQVRSCFTDDVHAHYDQRGSTTGIDALMASLQNFNKLKEGTMKITTHFMGNLVFGEIGDSVAETETNAIAFLVEPVAGADVVSVRSLRYLDRMRRERDGWRISDRIHTLDWSCRMPASSAVGIAQRLSVLPQRDER